MSDDTEDDCPCAGPPPTLCDGDITNNEWFESGVCMLDTMCLDQVVYVLQRNPKARDDLKRVTTCDELLTLVDQVPLMSGQQEDDQMQKTLNSADCLPQYTIFRGNTNNM